MFIAINIILLTSLILESLFSKKQKGGSQASRNRVCLQRGRNVGVVSMIIGVCFVLAMAFTYPMGGYIIVILSPPFIGGLGVVGFMLGWAKGALSGNIAFLLKGKVLKDYQDQNNWIVITGVFVVVCALSTDGFYGYIYGTRTYEIHMAASNQAEPDYLREVTNKSIERKDYILLRVIARNTNAPQDVLVRLSRIQYERCSVQLSEAPNLL